MSNLDLHFGHSSKFPLGFIVLLKHTIPLQLSSKPSWLIFRIIHDLIHLACRAKLLTWNSCCSFSVTVRLLVSSLNTFCLVFFISLVAGSLFFIFQFILTSAFTGATHSIMLWLYFVPHSPHSCLTPSLSERLWFLCSFCENNGTCRTLDFWFIKRLIL